MIQFLWQPSLRVPKKSSRRNTHLTFHRILSFSFTFIDFILFSQTKTGLLVLLFIVFVREVSSGEYFVAYLVSSSLVTGESRHRLINMC